MAEQQGLFQASVIANLLGISERRLQQLAVEGYVPKAERGLYPLVGSVQGYIRYLKELGGKQKRGNEHARLVRAQAIKVEMENARRRGELVLSAQVDDLLFTLSAELGAQLDGQLAGRANEIAGINEPAKCRELLLDTAHAIRRAVSERIEQWAQARSDGADSSEDPEAAAEEDAARVGGREPDVPAGERGAGSAS